MNAVPLGFHKQLALYVINYNDLQVEKSIAEGMKSWLHQHNNYTVVHTGTQIYIFVVILSSLYSRYSYIYYTYI